MKPLLSAIVAVLVTFPAAAALYDAEQIDNIYENETSGLRYYEKGEFEKAFMLLSRTAAQGMKRSQYILGFMFMKGEGVDRNMLFGLTWLGLATESGNSDWREMYSRLYDALSDAQKSMVDAKISDYREKYGAAAQGITCAKTAIVGSRKIDWVCRKSTGSYVEYEVELPIRAQ